jgi:N-terminal half of MaoC dehydratase
MLLAGRLKGALVYEVPIERGKIREFAKAANSTDAAYDGPEAIVPPTFLTTARINWQPAADNIVATLGFDLRRVLHGEEEYVYFGELPKAGQTLQVETRIGDRFEKQGKRGGVMRFAVIVSEFRDASGRLVAEQRSTLVETAAQSGGDGS